MKNTIRKKAVGITFCSLLIVTCSLFTACPSPLTGTGGNSVVSITIGGNSNVSKSVNRGVLLPWDPSIDSDNLEYTVTISDGPGVAQKQEGIKAGQTVRFTVSPGTWTVTVQGYEGTILVAEGSSKVNVKSGENTPAPVPMKETPPVFNSIPDFGAWLNGKPPTDDIPYNVKLNISGSLGDATVAGSLGNALRSGINATKYVKLDLSSSTITTIDSKAFYICNNLVSITLPNSVTSIGQNAFEFCDDLTIITLPNSVLYIMDSAFSYCTNLTSITIGNSVIHIGQYAFDGCDNLTSVTFEGLIPSLGIDAEAFPGNTDLRNKYTASPGGGAGTYTKSNTTPPTWTKIN
jgi:hypothetical protein